MPAGAVIGGTAGARGVQDWPSPRHISQYNHNSKRAIRFGLILAAPAPLPCGRLPASIGAMTKATGGMDRENANLVPDQRMPQLTGLALLRFVAFIVG